MMMFESECQMASKHVLCTALNEGHGHTHAKRLPTAAATGSSRRPTWPPPSPGIGGIDSDDDDDKCGWDENAMRGMNGVAMAVTGVGGGGVLMVVVGISNGSNSCGVSSPAAVIAGSMKSSSSSSISLSLFVFVDWLSV
jgi:hypothetical protein